MLKCRLYRFNNPSPYLVQVDALILQMIYMRKIRLINVKLKSGQGRDNVERNQEITLEGWENQTCINYAFW